MVSAPPDVPRELGRYALYDKIASGGMATVHLGRLLGPVGFARTVAIKRLHPQFATDPEFVSMFLDEARLVGRISHPNVVPTLDVVSLKDELFLVMEYVRGEALSRLMQWAIANHSPIPIPIVSAILVGVLHGLHAAHEAKSEAGQPLDIVHRDVSPQNVLVGADGIPRLVDFGVAKAVGRLQTTREGQLKGKLAYMAREQLAGEASRATDIYAASVVLWEMLTARRLFAGDTEAQVVAKVLEGCSIAPSTQMPGVPAVLDAITMRGLSVDPAKRYPTAREMALVLEDAVAPATASKVGAWVEMVAKATLDARSARIAAIESNSAVQIRTTAAVETKVEGSSAKAVLAARGSGWVVAAAIAVGLAAAVGLFALKGLRRGSAANLLTEQTESRAAPRATTLADLPPPPTKVPEAAAEYAAGMQALHDNSSGRAGQHFARTVELDPTIAIAHLRVAMTTLLRASSSVSKREQFAQAVALRAQLGPRDQALLEALEPILQRVRDDRAEARARLEKASQAFPLDVEFLDWLGLLYEGEPDKALGPAERAIALDPKDGQSLQNKGHSLALLGRNEEARAAFDGCADLALSSADCLVSLTRMDALEGKCDAFEMDARRLMDRDSIYGAPIFAAALLARGRVAAAEEAFEQGNAGEQNPALRGLAKMQFQAKLAILAGDFASAESLAREEVAAVSTEDATRSDFGRQLKATASLIDVLEETGQGDDAQKAAESFRARSDTWTTDSMGKGLDLSLRLLRTTQGHGGLSAEDFERRRAEWVDQRLNVSGAFPGLVWTFAYAAAAQTPEEGRNALAALPKFAPLTSFWLGSPSPDAYAGSASLLAGQPAQATAHLQRAVANCNGPAEPVIYMHAALQLGMATETTDVEVACAAYKIVLDHWGRAKPRSLSADRAKERARALGCGR